MEFSMGYCLVLNVPKRDENAMEALVWLGNATNATDSWFGVDGAPNPFQGKTNVVYRVQLQVVLRQLCGVVAKLKVLHIIL